MCIRDSVTYLLPLTRKQRGRQSHDLVSRATPDDISQAVTFLQEWNSRYQLAPVYALPDMLGQSRLLPGFSWENLYIYREGGNVLGTLGIWDQQSFKQTVVTDYSRNMRTVRPVYNLYASVRGIPRLPRIGAKINIVYAAFVSGDESAFAALLRRVCEDWSGRGYDYLSVGFCAGHPCSAVAARFAAQRIASTIYLVYWADGDVALPQTSRPVHVEIATL